MANFVHARRRDGRMVFRLWNTVVDRYETEELSRAEMVAYLDDPGAEKRVDRAEVAGTSSLRGDTRDLDGPWDEETGLAGMDDEGP